VCASGTASLPHLRSHPVTCRHVYVTCGDSIRCHSTRNGEILFTCSGHTDAVSGIAAHPLLSRQIITSSLDGTLRIWDADDGAFIRQVDVGAPISHIATTQLPAKSAAVVYLVVIVKQPKSAAAAALQQHAGSRGSVRVDYPLGDEVACLRPRPIGSSFVHTVGPSGGTRASPRSAVVELDLSSGNITQLIFRKEGFFVGMEARCMGASPVAGAQQGEVTPDIVLSFAVRRSVYVWRSSAVGSTLHKYKHNELLSTLSLHPSDSYMSTGDIVGHVRTWCSPLLSATAAGSLTSSSRQRWTASSSIATADFEPPIVHDAASIPTSMVHWHAHAVWGTSFLPDGSYMLSGGEEGVLVSWQLSGSHGAGKFGPSKDKRMMNFLPRLGASIRGVASYAVASGSDAAAFSADDKAATSGTHVRTTPALMFAAALVDNTFVVINGTTQNEMWRHRGLAIAGSAAIPSVGVMNSLAKYARKQIIKGARSVGARSGARSVSAAALAAALFSASSSSAALSLLADTAGHGADEDREGAEDPAALLASLSAESIGKSLRKATDRGILMASTTRYLRKGSVVDPRTKCLVVNTLPTKASLQWFDLRKQAGVSEVEVSLIMIS
jgi:WD40 repeat protein